MGASWGDWEQLKHIFSLQKITVDSLCWMQAHRRGVSGWPMISNYFSRSFADRTSSLNCSWSQSSFLGYAVSHHRSSFNPFLHRWSSQPIVDASQVSFLKHLLHLIFYGRSVWRRFLSDEVIVFNWSITHVRITVELLEYIWWIERNSMRDQVFIGHFFMDISTCLISNR